MNTTQAYDLLNLADILEKGEQEIRANAHTIPKENQFLEYAKGIDYQLRRFYNVHNLDLERENTKALLDEWQEYAKNKDASEAMLIEANQKLLEELTAMSNKYKEETIGTTITGAVLEAPVEPDTVTVRPTPLEMIYDLITKEHRNV